MLWIGTAVMTVVLAWWASTAVVLRLVWLRERRKGVLIGAAVLAAAGLAGVWWSGDRASLMGAYLAFFAALALWAGHELAFLLGAVTGPRRLPCPPSVSGWQRFRLATATLLHHEIALALTWLLVVVATWGAENQVATRCFGILWIMRITAKLSVFLGVRNFTDSFVPEHMRYLTTYFGAGRSDPLLAAVVLGGTAVTAWLGGLVGNTAPHSFASTGHVLVATLLGLAVVEHLFLALPLPDAALWRWVVQDKTVPSLVRADVNDHAPMGELPKVANDA